MRYGIISDVHANLPALETCIAHLRSAGIDGIVCLGDLVGYGPQPNEVVARIAELEIPSLVGNHDLVAAGLDPIDRAEGSARDTLRWTQDELDTDARTFLASLPRVLEMEGGVLAAHGAIDDPWRYVRRIPDVLEQLGSMRGRGDHQLLLLGHTHRQLAADLDSKRVATSGWMLARRKRNLSFGTIAYVNPGAVGQSREPRAVARCALVDLEARELSLFALRYPHDVCAGELVRRGLPKNWCHAPPTPKKTVRQALRDLEDRRRDLYLPAASDEKTRSDG